MWNLSGNFVGDNFVVGLAKIFRNLPDHGRKWLIVFQRLDRYFVELAIFWNLPLLMKAKVLIIILLNK